jgi:hypothetical protein
VTTGLAGKLFVEEQFEMDSLTTSSRRREALVRRQMMIMIII